MKRFISIIMACIMFCCFASVSAFAQEVEPSQAPSQESEIISTDVSPMSLGKLLATAGGTIYGSGSVRVTLPSGNFGAKFVARIGYTSESGLITCSVIDPDGDVYSLGSMSGSGSSSGSYEVFYAKAGTYTFYFSSTNSQYEVLCNIYD